MRVRMLQDLFKEEGNGKPLGEEQLSVEVTPEAPPYDSKSHLAVALGKAIEFYRHERGRFSQRHLAQISGISRHTLQEIEHGKTHNHFLSAIEKILPPLGITLRDLMEKVALLSGACVQHGSTDGGFVLQFPREGFRIVSMIPRCGAFFYGTFCLEAGRTVEHLEIPHSECVLFQGLKGRLLFRVTGREFLVTTGKYALFQGCLPQYEVYNPDPLFEAKSLLVTVPSFISSRGRF